MKLFFITEEFNLKIKQRICGSTNIGNKIAKAYF